MTCFKHAWWLRTVALRKPSIWHFYHHTFSEALSLYKVVQIFETWLLREDRTKQTGSQDSIMDPLLLFLKSYTYFFCLFALFHNEKLPEVIWIFFFNFHFLRVKLSIVIPRHLIHRDIGNISYRCWKWLLGNLYSYFCLFYFYLVLNLIYLIFTLLWKRVWSIHKWAQARLPLIASEEVNTSP